ncbi:hypothetical protein X975_18860, partial [Stegodyphus mimosarum]
MADVKDLKNTLVYAMKFEAAQQATLRDQYPMRAANAQEPVGQLIARLNDLTRQVNALRRYISDKKPTVKCWNCGALEHMRRNCRTPQSTENKTDDINTQLNAMKWKRRGKKPKCWDCGVEGHVGRSCKTARGTENEIISQKLRRRQINDRIEDWRLPDNEKPCFKALKISAVRGNSNALSINGHIDAASCNMIIDTEANVTVIRKDLAQQFKDKLIWTPSCVPLQWHVPNDVEIELQTVSKRCCLLSITGCEGLTLYSPRLPRHPCKIRMCCDLSQLEH